MKKNYIFECSNGERWSVPVMVIARDRAKYYAENDDDFMGDFDKSLNEDTIPLFESDTYEIADWAQNNMNWSDIKAHAVKVGDAEIDMQDEWVNPADTEFTD